VSVEKVAKKVEQLGGVIIRFAGDSGDGMQLAGDRFTSETATLGNDLATFPDFPAEIRAPAGSLPGVSGFQVHFADHDILTAGDRPDVLVAMNPAALRTNLGDLPKGGTLIVDADAFGARTLQKAGYTANPIEDGTLADYHVHEVALTSMTVGALKGVEGITSREAERRREGLASGREDTAPETRVAVEGCTEDAVERHFLGWADEVDADALFATGQAWGIRLVRRPI